VTVEGQDVPEVFCLITDLLDCEVYPARLPAAAVAAGTARLLAAVGRARHVTDRNRHRPRNTKARQAFEKAHRNTPTWIAEAVLGICGQAA
jgi:hypothetical protein